MHLIVIVAVHPYHSQTGRRRQTSVSVDVLVRRTDWIAVGGDHRLSGPETHVLHAVSVSQLVAGRHRRHDESAAVDGVAEDVPVGLVVVAGLLVVGVTVVSVHPGLRHQLRLLRLVNPVRIEVMRLGTGRRMLMLVLELGRLWDAVRRGKIGRLVVNRGSHWRIIIEPESSSCTSHRYVRS